MNNLPIMQVEEFNEAPLAVFFVCTKISLERERRKEEVA